MPRNPEMNSSDQDRDYVAVSRVYIYIYGKVLARMSVRSIRRGGGTRAQPTGEVSIAEEAVWRPRGEYKISRAG